MAVAFDREDVATWHTLASVAQKAERLDVARVALERGLRLNPRHWPCTTMLLQVPSAAPPALALAGRLRIGRGQRGAGAGVC